MSFEANRSYPIRVVKEGFDLKRQKGTAGDVALGEKIVARQFNPETAIEAAQESYDNE